jgi:hypothetical protein
MPCTISRHNTEETAVHHSGHPSAVPIGRSAAIVARGDAMSNASTRHVFFAMFLIGGSSREVKCVARNE